VEGRRDIGLGLVFCFSVAPFALASRDFGSTFAVGCGFAFWTKSGRREGEEWKRDKDKRIRGTGGKVGQREGA
jgi:hypothetical protein